jgi:predicted nucleic acid-binding Zn ribbon protein
MEKLEPGVAVPITHVQCRLCGHDMPADEDTCLHCGQVTRRVRVRQVLLAMGTLILLLLLGVAFLMSLGKSPMP